MEKIKDKVREIETLKKEIREEFRKFINKYNWINTCELVMNGGGQFFISWNVQYLTIDDLKLIDSEFAKVKEVRINHDFGNRFVIYLEV